MPQKSIWDNPNALVRLTQLIREDGHTAVKAASVLSEEFGIFVSRGAVVAKMHRSGIAAATAERHAHRVALTRKVIKAHTVGKLSEQMDELFGPRSVVYVGGPKSSQVCSWVYGDPADKTATFCGRKVDRKVDVDSCYCGYHTVLSLSSYWKAVAAYVKTSDPSVTGYSNIAFVTLDRDDRAMEKEDTHA